MGCDRTFNMNTQYISQRQTIFQLMADAEINPVLNNGFYGNTYTETIRYIQIPLLAQQLSITQPYPLPSTTRTSSSYLTRTSSTSPPLPTSPNLTPNFPLFFCKISNTSPNVSAGSPF